MPSIAIENLPAYEQISNEPIRQAAAQLDAARGALDESKKSHTAAELELPASEWRDAEISADARADGKQEPKTRAHTAKHERLIQDLAHELKVATISEQHAVDSLDAALIEFGQVWGEEVAAAVLACQGQWTAEVNELIALHGRFSAALSVARVVLDGDQGTAAALTFAPSQVKGREWASGQSSSVRPAVQLGDVLAGLADLALPPEPVEATPVEHALPYGPARGNGPREHGHVVAEQAEIREHNARLASPEGREAVAKARQERARQLREQREATEV
ncbi:MAG TPA: hypothetical protein VK538_08195 [Solirubrobacteraceae bacterium]|nr:hypothetical protein [Solirubrobacteraceae bacterium]